MRTDAIEVVPRCLYPVAHADGLVAVDPDTLRRTRAALGMVLGIESVVALRDVFGLAPEEVENAWRLARRAIVRAALDEGG